MNTEKINTTWELTKASLRMFVRNSQAFFFTLVFPLILIGLLGLIGFDRAPQFDVGLVVQNPNPETNQLVEQIKTFPTFKISQGTLEDELAALADDNRSVVLEIPSDLLSQSFIPRTIKAHINEGQQSQAQTTISVLNQVIDKAILTRAGVPHIITVEQQVVDSHDLKYIDFLLPGIVAMSIMQMSVFSVAFVFVQAKEKGILKRLFATPMKPSQFLTANVITRLIVSVVQAAILIAVGVLLLNAHVLGSYLLVLLIIILGVLMFLGLGFIISGIAKTFDSVPVFANLVVFPMLFLGGVFFPIDNMPNWLQNIAKFLPLTFFSNALREVMTKDAGLGAIKNDIFAMIIWSALLLAIATFVFRFQERE
jgi:ABC-2 type transport system permease protein